jgi:hypothetical protein
MVVSDGIHDNLDPQHMGLKPCDLVHLMPVDPEADDW